MGKRTRGREARSRRIGGRVGLALALVGVSALWATPARAADPYPAGNEPPPQVLGTSFFNDDPPAAASGAGTSDVGTSVGGRSLGATATGSELGFTGAYILILLVAALVALVLGLVLWRYGRLRSAPSDL